MIKLIAFPFVYPLAQSELCELHLCFLLCIIGASLQSGIQLQVVTELREPPRPLPPWGTVTLT